MRRIGVIHIVIAVSLPLSLMIAVSPTLAQGGSSRVPTVYKRGPEIHLLPDWGPVGTRVQVFGLGYRAGQRVGIAVGGPGAEMSGSLVQTTVRPNGSFHVSWRITCRLIRAFFKSCQVPSSNGLFLMLVGGYDIHAKSMGSKTQTTGFTISSNH